MFDIARILYAENEKEMIEAFLDQDIEDMRDVKTYQIIWMQYLPTVPPQYPKCLKREIANALHWGTPKEVSEHSGIPEEFCSAWGREF